MNQSVKFADLTALAADLGAERLATGHYVRRVDGPDGAELHRAADLARDQSWFLFATTRAQLGRCCFPLGRMQDKRTVRDEAARLGLAVAEKPDSQDICFVPSGSYAEIVGRLRPDALAPGEIVTRDGTVVGQHDGVARFTVGQSKRLGAAAMMGGARQMVIATEPGGRRVIIGPRDVATSEVRLREVNWLVAPRAGPLRCTVKRARATCRGRPRLRRARAAPWNGWTNPLCRPLARPVCFTTATGYWAAVSLRDPSRRPNRPFIFGQLLPRHHRREADRSIRRQGVSAAGCSRSQTRSDVATRPCVTRLVCSGRVILRRSPSNVNSRSFSVPTSSGNNEISTVVTNRPGPAGRTVPE